MGQEILYCYKCQTRLLGSEFEKGKAFKVGDKAACAVCVKDLLGSVPAPPPKVETALKSSSSNRIPAASSDSSPKIKPPTVRAAAPNPDKSRNGLIVGAVIGVAVILILIAMAMKSGSGPTARRDPDPAPAPPAPPPVRPPDPPPVPPTPPTSTFAAELREIDEKINAGVPKEEFRSLAQLLVEARTRRSSADWLNEIDQRIPQIEARARRAAVPLRDKAVEANKKSDAAEVKRLRDKISAWGFPSIVDEFDKALAAPVAPPPPPPPPPPPTVAEPPLVVYDDALAPGWQNWSWNGAVDLAATSPVFEGSRSISMAPQKEAAGIYFHFEQGLDPAQYRFVTFAAYVTDEKVNATASIYRDKKSTSSINLDQLCPDFKLREWRKYVVPIDKLNPDGDRITGVQFQAFKISSEPVVYVDSIAFLKGIPPPKPAPTEIDAYRARWSQAAAKAAVRDYAGAQKDLEEAAAALKTDAAAKSEAASDLELLKLASQVPGEASKIIERWTKGQKVKLEILNGTGEKDLVDGAVLSVDAVRLSIQRDSGPIDIPVAEIAPASLAEIFRGRADRKPTDVKAAALFAFFEGEGAGLPEKPGVTPKERSSAETAARRTFWTAEAEFHSPRRRPAAVEKFTAFLAGEPAGYVARLRPYVAARLEAAKDTVFLADDLSGGGTFTPLSSTKLDMAWTSMGDSGPSKARENFVEAEFTALPGALYRAWIWAGACCQETFEFQLQGSEFTAPNPKNAKEPLSCEPGAETTLAAKLPSVTLKKWHAQHGGPKEPARWEWIPVTLPKYETAGLKKLRVLTAQQGFSVGAIVVSAIRRETPKDPEMKELEKARFGIRKSGNTGPMGFIVQEFWENIDGDTVESLVKHPSYAGKPTGTSIRESLEGVQGYKDRYGSRMRGFIHPPVTGAYVFWISSDDGAELHVSVDDTPVRKRLVCSSPWATNFREWTRNAQQKSGPIVLAAGKRYYVEVLQKDGTGNDHVSVGWTLPDGTEEKPIPGSRLSPLNAAPLTPGPPGTVFFRGYNLNGPPTVIDGRRWEGKGAKDLAFSTEGAFENQSVPLNPPTDDAKAAMIRSSAFSADGTAVKVYQMPAGSYLVYLYVWEDNFDQVYDLFVQGKEVLKGLHSGTAGHWDKLGPYPVTFSDVGTLDFKTNGGHANVSGVEIWKVGK